MKKSHIDMLRTLNYELVKNLGLFKRRANLPFGQRHILYHIDIHTGVSIRELALLLHVDQSTMSRNIKKLEQRGWVNLYLDELDKRKKALALSDAGKAVLAEATDSINRTIACALETLSEEETEAIIKYVRLYSKALENGD